MRVSAFLLALAAGCAIIATFTYFQAFQSVASDRRALVEAELLPAAFAKQRCASLRFALEELTQWHHDPILVDRTLAHPDSRQFVNSQNDLGFCSNANDSVDKGQAWYSHAVCGGVANLPDGFFTKPPYLHLSGHSYVRLASKTSPERFGSVDWLTEHKSYMHLSELAEVATLGVRLTPVEELLTELDKPQIAALLEGTAFVFGEEQIFLALYSSTEPGSTAYGVYSRAEWEQFLASTPLEAFPGTPNSECFARVGQACFRVAPTRDAALTRWPTVFAVGALLNALAYLLLSHGRRRRAQRREQEARVFMLQTLGHEIRTPATSLALSLETMRRHFDDMPEPAQPAFLRACDNVQRLQRVIEETKKYMREEALQQKPAFRENGIPSVDDFVRDILECYPGKIHFRGLGQTVSARLDAHWIGTCLRNLIENAVLHGAEPVVVKLQRDETTLVVTVQDGGNGSTLSVREMTSAFRRGSRSTGLGFGLAVVKRMVESMGGTLRYQRQPTRFSMVLKHALVSSS